MLQYPLNVSRIPGSGYRITLRPDERERGQLARALGVSAIPLLEADITVRRWLRDGVEVAGQVRASVEQPCVVTLEPVLQAIDTPFRARFIPADSRIARRQADHTGELLLDPEGDDIPDSFSGDTIDIWPVVSEHLALEIDLFPRAAGAELAEPAPHDDNEPARESPFAALRKLKEGDE
ncbi:MAG: DUF177 domain-containing protein [Rhizobiaceae bacterium]